jgi:exodeoxyribonuclease VII small subunit
MAAQKKKYKDFESALARLEEITGLLESGEAGLEEAIALYTEGVEVASFCHQKLSRAEKQIMILKEQNQKIVETPLDEDADEVEDADYEDDEEDEK